MGLTDFSQRGARIHGSRWARESRSFSIYRQGDFFQKFLPPICTRYTATFTLDEDFLTGWSVVGHSSIHRYTATTTNDDTHY